MRLKRASALLCLLLHGALFCFSQDADLNEYLRAYPQEPLVYINKSDVVDIRVKKDQLGLVMHHREEFMLLKSNYNPIRSRKVRTDDFLYVSNIDANLYVYNGKTRKKTKIESIDLRSENEDNSTFYDDDKYYKISFLTAKEGDIVTIDYDVEYREPRLFGVFYFGEYYPTLKSSVTVNYPSDGLKLNLKEVNNQKLQLLASKDSTKKTRSLSWTCKAIEPISDEYMDAGFRDKSSFLLLNIEQYRTKDSLVQLGGKLNNVYSWYTQFLKNVDLSPDVSLKAFTDSLVKNEVSESDKVKSIYYWVQNKIAYLAYEDGLNGYIPREASVVFKQKFGDCKDMCNLIVRMCRLVGLPVYPAWIGTRDIPYQFTEFPAPFCANHMIATYISNSDTIFLDATGKNHPFKLPTSMIQGKEALIGISDSVFRISKVPYTNGKISEELDSVIVAVEKNNLLKGRGFYKLTGYERTKMYYYLGKKSYEAQKQHMRSILEKGNNKFRLDTFFVMQDVPEKPLTIAYTFALPDYATSYEKNTFINFNFLKDYFDKLEISKRRYPIDFTYNSVHRLYVSLDIGPDQSADFIPENLQAANDLLSFNMRYKAVNKTICFENTIAFLKPVVHHSDFSNLEQITNSYKKNKAQLVSINTKK